LKTGPLLEVDIYFSTLGQEVKMPEVYNW
jgi:hypothetical protein